MSILIGATKRFVANSKLAAAIVLGAALVSFGPAANAVSLSYSTSGAPTQIKLGDALGAASTYDWLQIQGASGTINTDPSTILLNTLYFTAGPNAIIPAVYDSVYSFTETMTIGTSTGTLVVPFNLSINYSDTLTVVGGSTLSMLVGGNLWNIVVNGLTIGPNPGGTQTGYLYAQVSDPVATPLPAALVLFGSGLGAMGLLARRRKPKASAVPVA
jgi:hypothetical protein